jgi:hypothetical protein
LLLCLVFGGDFCLAGNYLETFCNFMVFRF